MMRLYRRSCSIDLLCTALSIHFLATFSSAQSNSACLPCDAVLSLLASCKLPSLFTPVKTFTDAGTTFRNITGAPVIYGNIIGPSTYIIATYEDASCFCTEGIHMLFECGGCTKFPQTTSGINAFHVSIDYTLDCEDFGYYVNSTQAYPSTTLTSLPTATVTPDQAEEIEACSDCSIVAAQIEQCGLTPLSNDQKQTLDHPELDDTTFSRYVLFNRTAGECFCTNPVFDSLGACYQCASYTKKNSSTSAMASNYQHDCMDLGYFGDGHPVVYRVPSSSKTPAATQKSSVTSPTSGATSGAASGTGSSGVKNAGSAQISNDLVSSRFAFVFIGLLTVTSLH